MNEALKEKIKQKTKFGKDIFKTLADAFRENYDLWNTLQFEEWVRVDDVRALLDEVAKQIQDNRDKVTVWVKNNLIDRKDFVDDDDFNGYALELSNAIQVFINREVLAVLEGEK